MGNRAGILAKNFPRENIANLIALYYENTPDLNNPLNRVEFGTSGHRGTPLNGSYTQKHIKAIAQAVVTARKQFGIEGPMFLGMDTHALSEAALKTTIEVLLANNIEVIVAPNFAYTPTPVISFMIVTYNKSNDKMADGIIITPSHNPPSDGGFKYNPPHGGPATPDYTKKISDIANEILLKDLKDVKWQSWEQSLKDPNLHYVDMQTQYVNALPRIINMQAISDSKLKIAVNPQGGASLRYWENIVDEYKLNLDIINKEIDPAFPFIPYDFDDHIRMDCMSPFTMKPLIVLHEQYDFLIANDPDADRHGVVSKQGLVNSNHYLSVILNYLLQTRKYKVPAIGKTVGASMMMDRIISHNNYAIFETPIGFKWFSQKLFNEKLGFACEESAGASFLDFKGQAFSTDKDGFIASLIGAEFCATTNHYIEEGYKQLEELYGKCFYGRVDVPIEPQDKKLFAKLTADSIKDEKLAGSEISLKITKARGNNEAVGGVRVESHNGWFTARPSGTENIYKIYYESFISDEHAEAIKQEASVIVKHALNN